MSTYTRFAVIGVGLIGQPIVEVYANLRVSGGTQAG